MDLTSILNRNEDASAQLAGSRQHPPSNTTNDPLQHENLNIYHKNLPSRDPLSPRIAHHNNIKDFSQYFSHFNPSLGNLNRLSFKENNFNSQSSFQQSKMDQNKNSSLSFRPNVTESSSNYQYTPNPNMNQQSKPTASDELENQPPKQFSCITCARNFSRRSDLVRHERIHTGVKPNVCGLCGKQFIQRSALTVHMRVHTGEKPHKCDICDKAFSDSSSLARHRRVHTGKRPYVCEYPGCNKTFTRRTTLTRHFASHIPLGDSNADSNMDNDMSLAEPRSSSTLPSPRLAQSGSGSQVSSLPINNGSFHSINHTGYLAERAESGYSQQSKPSYFNHKSHSTRSNEQNRTLSESLVNQNSGIMTL